MSVVEPMSVTWHFGSGYIRDGQDQGNFHSWEKDPSKELKSKLNKKHCSKSFQDQNHPLKEIIFEESHSNAEMIHGKSSDKLINPILKKTNQPNSSKRGHLLNILQELVSTEKSYVRDLKEIIQGYYQPLKRSNHLSDDDIDAIFCNITAIYNFNRRLLRMMQENAKSAVAVGRLFINNQKDFHIYTIYCTNYGRAQEALNRHTSTPHGKAALAIQKCQCSLNHSLPLVTYLFKPVQRILKYHLLFKNLLSKYDELISSSSTLSSTPLSPLRPSHPPPPPPTLTLSSSSSSFRHIFSQRLMNKCGGSCESNKQLLPSNSNKNNTPFKNIKNKTTDNFTGNFLEDNEKHKVMSDCSKDYRYINNNSNSKSFESYKTRSEPDGVYYDTNKSFRHCPHNFSNCHTILTNENIEKKKEVLENITTSEDLNNNDSLFTSDDYDFDTGIGKVAGVAEVYDNGFVPLKKINFSDDITYCNKEIVQGGKVNINNIDKGIASGGEERSEICTITGDNLMMDQAERFVSESRNGHDDGDYVNSNSDGVNKKRKDHRKFGRNGIKERLKSGVLVNEGELEICDGDVKFAEKQKKSQNNKKGVIEKVVGEGLQLEERRDHESSSGGREESSNGGRKGVKDRNTCEEKRRGLSERGVMVMAHECMVKIASNINEEKRLQEVRAKMASIESKIVGTRSEDLRSLGKLIHEGKLWWLGLVREEVQTFLLSEGMVLLKRRRDGAYTVKSIIKKCHLILGESIKDQPACFRIFEHNKRNSVHTFQAESLAAKVFWCQQVKKVILQSFDSTVTPRVWSLVMGQGKEDAAYINGGGEGGVSEVGDRRLEGREEEWTGKMKGGEGGNLLVGEKVDNTKVLKSHLDNSASPFDASIKKEIKNVLKTSTPLHQLFSRAIQLTGTTGMRRGERRVEGRARGVKIERRSQSYESVKSFPVQASSTFYGDLDVEVNGGSVVEEAAVIKKDGRSSLEFENNLGLLGSLEENSLSVDLIKEFDKNLERDAGGVSECIKSSAISRDEWRSTAEKILLDDSVKNGRKDVVANEEDSQLKILANFVEDDQPSNPLNCRTSSFKEIMMSNSDVGKYESRRSMLLVSSMSSTLSSSSSTSSSPSEDELTEEYQEFNECLNDLDAMMVASDDESYEQFKRDSCRRVDMSSTSPIIPVCINMPSGYTGSVKFSSTSSTSLNYYTGDDDEADKKKNLPICETLESGSKLHGVSCDVANLFTKTSNNSSEHLECHSLSQKSRNDASGSKKSFFISERPFSCSSSRKNSFSSFSNVSNTSFFKPTQALCQSNYNLFSGDVKQLSGKGDSEEMFARRSCSEDPFRVANFESHVAMRGSRRNSSVQRGFKSYEGISATNISKNKHKENQVCFRASEIQLECMSNGQLFVSGRSHQSVDGVEEKKGGLPLALFDEEDDDEDEKEVEKAKETINEEKRKKEKANLFFCENKEKNEEASIEIQIKYPLTDSNLFAAGNDSNLCCEYRLSTCRYDQEDLPTSPYLWSSGENKKENSVFKLARAYSNRIKKDTQECLAKNHKDDNRDTKDDIDGKVGTKPFDEIDCVTANFKAPLQTCSACIEPRSKSPISITKRYYDEYNTFINNKNNSNNSKNSNSNSNIKSNINNGNSNVKILSQTGARFITANQTLYKNG